MLILFMGHAVMLRLSRRCDAPFNGSNSFQLKTYNSKLLCSVSNISRD
jgi:hypothetical protein